MAHDGTGTGWDIASPGDAEFVPNGAKEIRDLRKGAAIRHDKEHVALAATSGGGEHKPGSAVAYYGGAAPTTRPDGVTALSAADVGRLWVDAGVLKAYTGATWSGIGVGVVIPVATLSHEVASGTQAGTFAAGVWVTRPLNTEVDPNGIVTLAANQFTLAAGTYLFRARASAFRVNGHQIRLRNITDGTTSAVGSSSHSGSAADYGTPDSVVDKIVTIAGGKTFEIQHRCQTAGAVLSSFGRSAGFGEVEVYCQVEILKLS